MKRSRGHDQDSDLEAREGESLISSRLDNHGQPNPKLVQLDTPATAKSQGDDESINMICSLPPHREPLSFNTYSDYEVHYNKFHTNRCLECRKNFPSEHLLGVHIEECHDPLVQVRRDKGEHTVRQQSILS